MYFAEVLTRVTVEPLRDDHPLLGSLVGTDEKFAAHNPARGGDGVLVHVPEASSSRAIYIRLRT